MDAFLRVIIPAALLLAVAIVLLGVKVLFIKGARFPSGHVHDSEALRARGITCAHHGPSSQKETKQNNTNSTYAK